MQKHLLGHAAIIAVIAAGSAHADDSGKDPPPSPPSQYNWDGSYIGLTAGAAWGQYDPRTSTVSDGYIGPRGAAGVNAAGAQTIEPSGFVTGIEGGYNWRTGNLLFGAEADLQALNLQGATNSGAVHYLARAGEFTVTSYDNTNWLFTARPRIGFVAPNNWLFYATGGLALTQLQSNFSFVDTNTALESGRLDTTKAGYAVGGGVEAPLTGRVSFKADYLHVDFANTSGMVTAQTSIAPLPLFSGQIFAHSSDLKADIVRVGLNYRFGSPDMSPSSDPIMPLKAPVRKAPAPINTDWEIETGARFWFSSGTLGDPNPFEPSHYGSRLTFSNLDAISGETFARVDHASGLFVKGFLGAGAIANGRLNDEDTLLPAGGSYSNELLSSSGQIDYATADIGYNFLRSPGAKIGAFVGYNYYAQALNTYGCTQIAGGVGCATPFPSSLLGGSENDHLNSLRVGLSSEVVLGDRLKLTTDVAYLPRVAFGGLDDHLVRQLLYFENSNGGDGVMLEAIMDYKITDAWSMGIGGRYWAWNMNTGTFAATFLTTGSAGVAQARFDNERYGLFAQTSYHWGDGSPSATSIAMPTKALVLASAPVNWTGVYVGGHMGGGWSDDRWSDPFGSTIAVGGGVNVAGFGDQTHATGPLGGAQIGANWQTGPWVLGVETDASAAHMRGENTCFTGLGGVDCQHIVNSLGIIAGRVGYAWERSLAYVKGGGAWTDTIYNLFANTLKANLGTGSTTLDIWGWTLGGGIEYALTEHWTTLAEYDHIGLPSTPVPFPTVAVINTRTIRANQSVDLFKVGVNYKFDLASLGASAR